MENSVDDENYIDLVEIARDLRERSLFLAAVIFVGVVVAVVYSLFLPNSYRAETVLAPAEIEQNNPGFSNSLGGAAALLGVSFGSSSDTSVKYALAVLTSREFLGRFIVKHDLEPSLFAGVWNSDTGISGINSDIYDISSGNWLNEGGEPSAQEAYRKFRRLLKITGPDRDTGLITVAITWIDPVQASEWANWLVSELNAELRMNDVNEATEAIEYLHKQLENTSLVEMQRVFYQLIESQTRITMLADIREEYMFKVIDPAEIPDQKSGPRRSYIAISGGFLGLLAGLILVLFTRNSSRKIDASK